VTDFQQKFLETAETAARGLGHHYVGTEHLLLAALQAPEVTAMLKREDFQLTAADVEKRLIRPPSGTEVPAILITDRSRKALERAASLSEDPSVLHVLLALAEDGEGVAAQLLEDTGLTAHGIRKQLAGS
jgi:ATP-dependent Clp protease ATP-binding subunit ClpA